ncbi:MAG: hypothetical protein CMJ32_03935 [Phycisphaerae bacterium]|nr:hypothetical protein [Phycisphaerae bacterium]
MQQSGTVQAVFSLVLGVISIPLSLVGIGLLSGLVACWCGTTAIRGGAWQRITGLLGIIGGIIGITFGTFVLVFIVMPSPALQEPPGNDAGTVEVQRDAQGSGDVRPDPVDSKKGSSR